MSIQEKVQRIVLLAMQVSQSSKAKAYVFADYAGHVDHLGVRAQAVGPNYDLESENAYLFQINLYLRDEDASERLDGIIRRIEALNEKNDEV